MKNDNGLKQAEKREMLVPGNVICMIIEQKTNYY